MSNGTYDKVVLVGHVGRDAEMRYTPGGTAVASFSVACNRQWQNAAGETQTQTIWYRVSSWGARAEVANQYVKKGMKILVEGQLQPNDDGNPNIWESNGEARASFEVKVTGAMTFLSRPNGAGGPQGQAQGNQKPAPAQGAQDDIPF